MLAILILAAGSSSRMRGQDKLLGDIAGAPLLARICTIALNTDYPVFVALRPNDHDRQTALSGLNVTHIPIENAANGMGTTIATALLALPEGITGVMILPADMPELTSEDLTQVAAEWRKTPDQILRATSQDQPGHPVIFPALCFERLKALSGDQGARGLLKNPPCPVRFIPLAGAHATTDLDTPEDWQAWRASQGL